MPDNARPSPRRGLCFQCIEVWHGLPHGPVLQTIPYCLPAGLGIHAEPEITFRLYDRTALRSARTRRELHAPRVGHLTSSHLRRRAPRCARAAGRRLRPHGRRYRALARRRARNVPALAPNRAGADFAIMMGVQATTHRSLKFLPGGTVVRSFHHIIRFCAPRPCFWTAAAITA
jgi:hypothetical protein